MNTKKTVIIAMLSLLTGVLNFKNAEAISYGVVGPVRYKKAEELCQKKGYQGLVTFEDLNCEWTDEEVGAGHCSVEIDDAGWIYAKNKQSVWLDYVGNLHIMDFSETTKNAICKKYEENDKEDASQQEIKHKTLTEKNYMTIVPDFEFEGMNIFYSDVNIAREECSDESKDFYCIYGKYKQLGQQNIIKNKYLGKIIKVPFYVWSSGNTNDGAVITDHGSFYENQPQQEAAYCFLSDFENINRFVKETENKKGDYDVIGVLSDIDSFDGMLVLKPCFYIGKHKKKEQ